MKRSILSIASISKKFGDYQALDNINLDVAEGEFITLLGPSGCGKTTLLRLIAGFETPDEGDILLEGASIIETAPEKRKINTVFQSYALFPHLTVYENVAFGLRLAGVTGQELDERVRKALSQTRMTGFESRFPNRLSGGQQQRVAMARAIVNRPKVLLLDEPLSALDARLRREMQIELKRIQRELGMTFILVSHEQDEALSLSDRVVVMQTGKIAQIGTPKEVYEEPESLYVAKFVGDNNLVSAKVEARLGDSHYAMLALGKEVQVHSKKDFEVGEEVYILLRPEDLRIVENDDIEPGMPIFEGTIAERSYRGATLDTSIQLEAGPIFSACEFFNEDDPEFDYSIGQRVNVSWVPGWEVVLRNEV